MDTSTVHISVDGTEEEIDLPADVLPYFGEETQTPASTVVDLLIVDCTHRLHGEVHHTEGQPDESLRTLEAEMRELFEERFGASFAELTGHQH